MGCGCELHALLLSLRVVPMILLLLIQKPRGGFWMGRRKRHLHARIYRVYLEKHEGVMIPQGNCGYPHFRARCSLKALR